MPRALRNLIRWLIVMGCIALLLFAGLLYVRHSVGQTLMLNEPVLYKVQPGTSAAALVRDFDNQGWLPDSRFTYRLWLKFFAADTRIKTGTYALSSDMSVPDVIALMVAGEEYQFSVRLVEGLTLDDWLVELKAQDTLVYDITPPVIVSLVEQWPYDESEALPENASVSQRAEGLFLADTYYYTDGTPASAILRRAMEAMTRFLDQQWRQRQSDLPLTSPLEVLVLASIIEKETAVASERAHIAGVFINRLRSNMRLQTDPTVIYGLGDTFDGNLTRAHLKQATPYNTYVIRGLPPTPIAMAGKPAIEAALNPLPTDDLYFVARGDGTHVFSSTLEAHNRAVYEYQILPNKKK
ncbi:endolytic transglycosylase MltG [Alteromonas sp. CYL-A6]|uniref:endolytic transglycosylase MltG n=1 Tax=Alteromonas nitratireducens TaxID=3390813 RepID=UPI0034BE9025